MEIAQIIGHYQIKVNVSHFTTIPTLRSYILALARVIKLYLGLSVNQLLKYKKY